MGLHSTSVRLIGPPQADGEYVALRESGSEEIVHIHDYVRLYRMPGLYEYIVQELLGCRSPQVAAEALGRALTRLALEPARVRLLDLGAGTGLVGELVRELGVATVVGLDTLAAAREACLRDRPGVYRDYIVGDLADPGPELLAELRFQRLGGLVAAGAFGGTHMPGSGLVNALALLPPGAPVVFTIDERWTHTDAPGGFRAVLSRLLASGELQLLERSRFEHRLTTTGEAVHYELLVAATGVPRLTGRGGDDGTLAGE
jgi:SAM-dependent methyltransferase